MIEGITIAALGLGVFYLLLGSNVRTAGKAAALCFALSLLFWGMGF